MAQKDKIKELVGRGLDSYHTKALQQMDRIEKKNKEQNYKISILTNELDNDYLTKTEEGSVISLEYSKEGMVYLDELQGNTMVNYCSDGEKELTLNGDIDVEGTSVTLTEGVDNGLVDVICEGNTLVNLARIPSADYPISINHGLSHSYPMISTTKDITLIARFKNISSENPRFRFKIGNRFIDDYYKELVVLKFSKSEIGDDVTRVEFGTHEGGNLATLESLLILEGDWTDKEIPPYFEGMKSVGECEGNKIEILSRNKNLWDAEMVKKQNGQKPPYTKNNNIITYFDIGEYGIYVPIKVKKSETLRISGTVKNVQNIRIFKASDNFKGTGVYSRDYNGIETEVSPHYICTFPEDGEYYIRIWCKNTGTPILTNFLAEISSTNTTYVEHKSNKKEISLNEPLRALPNGVKDKIVKIGGKWYVERNCTEERVLDTWKWVKSSLTEDYYYHVDDRFKFSGHQINVLCDKFKSATTSQANDENFYTNNNDYVALGTHSNVGVVAIDLSSDKLFDKTVGGFQEYLRNNEINIIYPLTTPYYEELPIDLTLNTYNDITHISNNSTIPCNMKVKNSGYNAIIKPSTQYTVTLDTNKSGTIGINLGGSKVTTTNNVATVTTPSTLTDDTLRLTGKGIKASRVRLLEGDKTNWIPSYFEGMKSCFEDKLQDDGTYKMEILSNNKNLFNGTWVYNEGNNRIESRDLIKVKPNTTYTISDNLNYRYQIYEYADKNTHFNSIYPYAGSYTFTTSKRTHYLRFSTYAPSTDVNVKFLLEEGRSVNSYEPNKSNKIQFSSIEPLRGVCDVKDRFVFKDNKLMIERRFSQIKIKDSMVSNIYRNNETESTIAFRFGSMLYPNWQSVASNSRSNLLYKIGSVIYDLEGYSAGDTSSDFYIRIDKCKLDELSVNGMRKWLRDNEVILTYQLIEPLYEEIPHELQKIILEGYEDGTLFIDTNIPPTSTVTYAGETPIVKSVKLNKTEVSNNTNDINDNIVPYLMDMDYRVVCLQLEGGVDNISMARLFGGAFEMLQRDIQSKRYSVDEYKYRLDAYLSANKITEDEYNKLGDMLND